MTTSLTFKRIMSIAMLAALLGAWVQLARWNEQLAQLSQRMSTLEHVRSAAAEQVRPAGLDSRRSAIPAARAQKRQTPLLQTQAKESQTNASQLAVQSAVGNLEPTSPVFEEMAQQGYIDDQSWQAFDERIKSMSKAENKLFWQQMSAAIEKGDVAVYLGPRG